MINLNVVCVGNVKETSFKEAINEYLKRITKFANIKIVEVKEERISKNPTKAEIENVVEEEGKRILNHMQGFVVVCDGGGKMLTSMELANKLKKVESSFSTITFVIGGSYGLSDLVKSKANLLLSFSAFTFPHQLFRIMLLEQIYRAYTIVNNITYHK